jgi:hypothetical protein
LALTGWILSAPLFCHGQDDVHCFPLAESRQIHALAMQKLIQDSVINELAGKIDLLEDEKTTIRRDFTALLAAETEKTSLANQVSEQQKLVSQSHERENKELRKKNRSLRFQRTGAVILGVILAGLAVVN